MVLNQDFKEFIESLNDNNVRYLIFGVPPSRIDLLIGLKGMDFESCYPSRVEVEIDGVQMSFIDLENLRQSKRLAGRLQDLADLENLD